MSQENLELTRRWTLAYNERDLGVLYDLTASDLEFLPYLATLIEQEVYRGHDGLRRHFAMPTRPETIQVRVDEVSDVHECTIGSGELLAKGRTSGLDVRVALAWVCEFREGKLVRVETFASRDAALDPVGLGPRG